MNEREHFLLLDGLRGVAALAVVWYHLHFVVGYDDAGPLAVDLFFMLSGFVIAAAYDQRLDRDLSVLMFMKRRYVRLYPMFFAGLVVALMVQQVLIAFSAGALDERQTLYSFVIEAFWLPSPFNGGTGWTFPLNGPAWSLSLEIVANLLFAVFHRRLSDGVLAGVVAISAIAILWDVLDIGTINNGWSWATLPFGVARVGYAFPLGVLMYRRRDLIPVSIGRLPPWLPLVALAFVLFLPEMRAIDLIFLTIGAPLLIATGFRTTITGHAIPYRRLGDISYPIYAVHGSLVLLVQGATTRLKLEAIGPIIGLVSLAGLAILSLILARWELSAREWLTRRLIPRRLRAHAAQPTG